MIEKAVNYLSGTSGISIMMSASKREKQIVLIGNHDEVVAKLSKIWSSTTQ